MILLYGRGHLFISMVLSKAHPSQLSRDETKRGEVHELIGCVSSRHSGNTKCCTAARIGVSALSFHSFSFSTPPPTLARRPNSLSPLSHILPPTFLTTRTRLKSSGLQAAVCSKISFLLFAGAASPITFIFIYFAFEHLPSLQTGRAPVVKNVRLPHQHPSRSTPHHHSSPPLCFDLFPSCSSCCLSLLSLSLSLSLSLYLPSCPPTSFLCRFSHSSPFMPTYACLGKYTTPVGQLWWWTSSHACLVDAGVLCSCPPRSSFVVSRGARRARLVTLRDPLCPWVIMPRGSTCRLGVWSHVSVAARGGFLAARRTLLSSKLGDGLHLCVCSAVLLLE
ncbi:hypothetical protein BCR43DRAFT_240871 [Syncephalastrum racemosum]|uniref:Uncharacterized protein n=1 Tax=Syncephalastrum racemosum TaxID=13706 RepID=A0A1X2HEW0_SYNRA|nr:hypothetical protein BCR43DRAFT_240871 [Syncephalastrum racemosum]